MEESKKVKVTRNRKFSAHHMLIDAANMALKDAKKKNPVFFYNHLIAITFSALAVEALANAFGKVLFKNGWEDFERSDPIAKLRIVCFKLKIEPDFEHPPWSIAKWLKNIRNKIVHAKPQIISEEKIINRNKYDDLPKEGPKSKIEKEITLKNAQLAVDGVKQIRDILCEKIPPEIQFGLRSDGWEGSASIVD